MDKIVLEEHIESPDFQATGSHNFTDSVYFANVVNTSFRSISSGWTTWMQLASKPRSCC